MGPPPKQAEKRARRNATVSMTRLPAEGWDGPTPKWPLLDDVAKTSELKLLRVRVREQRQVVDDPDLPPRRQPKAYRELISLEQDAAKLAAAISAERRVELQVWRQVWATPQAAQWQRLGWTRDVATYVRLKVRGELGDLDCAKEARQWSDRLGLNPLALLRLRWAVAADEVGEQRQANDAATAPASRYGHLGVVADAAETTG